MSKPQPRRYCYTARPNTCTPSHIPNVTASPLLPTPGHPATSKTLLPHCLSQHLYTQPHSRCYCPRRKTCTPSHTQDVTATPLVPNTCTPSDIKDVTALVPTPVHPATSKTLLPHCSSQHLYTELHPRRYCLCRKTCTPSHIQDVTSTPLVPTPIHPAISKTLLPHRSSQHLYTQPHPICYCHTARPNTCTPSHIQDVTSTPLVPTPIYPTTSKTLLPLSQNLYTQPHPRRYCPPPNTCTPSHIQDVTATLLVQTPVHRATSKTLLPLVQHLYTQLHPRRYCPRPNTCTPSYIQDIAALVPTPAHLATSNVHTAGFCNELFLL